MARPQKTGLSYFPFDSDFFSNRKVKMLLKAYGPIGVTLYLYILCEIHKDLGYYLKLDDDEVELICSELDICVQELNEIIEYCIKREIFDAELWDNRMILTSAYIQEVYQRAKINASRKVNIKVDEEIWLLDAEKTSGFIIVCDVKKNSGSINCNSDSINCNSDSIYPQNKVKESKIKENKEKENKENYIKCESESKAIRLFETAYPELTLEQKAKIIMYVNNGAPDVMFEYAVDEAVKRGKNAFYALAIVEDALKDNPIKVQETVKSTDASYDLNEFEKTVWNVPK